MGNSTVLPYNMKRLEDSMDREDCELVIASTAQNIRYFTGFTPVVKVLNPNTGECYAILHRETANKVSVIHSLGESDQILDMLAPLDTHWLYGTFYRADRRSTTLLPNEEALIDLGPSVAPTAAAALILALQSKLSHSTCVRILIDEDGMPFTTRNTIERTFPNAIFVDGSQVLRYVRAVKAPHEILLLTRAARQNEHAVQICLEAVREGTSEKDLVHMFESSVAGMGGRTQATMIKLGRHATTGQRRPVSTNVAAQGEIIWFDSDTTYDGYWSDIARTASLKYISARQATYYSALQSGMSAGFEALVPGNTGSDVFRIVMQAVRNSGLPDYARHHVGHGIGLEAYEGISLSAADTTIIEPGMVVSLETPYYEYGIGALHIEEPVLITEAGPQYLTTSPNPGLQILQ